MNGEVAAEATLQVHAGGPRSRQPRRAKLPRMPRLVRAMSEVDPRAIVSPSARIGQRRAHRRLRRGRRRRRTGRRLRPRAARRGARPRAHRPQECFRFVLLGGRRSPGSEIQRRAHRTDRRRRQPLSRILHGEPRHDARRRRHAHRQRQSLHGLFARGPRLHCRQPHGLRQWRDAGGPRGRGGLRQRRRVQPGAPVLPRRAATPTSAPAPSSRRMCRRFRAWSPSAKRIATA